MEAVATGVAVESFEIGRVGVDRVVAPGEPVSHMEYEQQDFGIE